MELGDFIKQVPATVLLAPIVFGAVYIALTIYIFRKAAKRKRLKREALSAQMPQGQQNNESAMPLGNFLSGELPNKPVPAADWAVPPELRDLPEPDLDMLS